MAFGGNHPSFEERETHDSFIFVPLQNERNTVKQLFQTQNLFSKAEIMHKHGFTAMHWVFKVIRYLQFLLSNSPTFFATFYEQIFQQFPFTNNINQSTVKLCI